MPSSNFLVCMLHTPVSSDGTTLNIRAVAGVSASVTLSNTFRQVKSGALSPGFSSDPARFTAPPLNVTVLAIVAPEVRDQRTEVRDHCPLVYARAVLPPTASDLCPLFSDALSIGAEVRRELAGGPGGG